jgi:hypothetical protein
MNPATSQVYRLKQMNEEKKMHNNNNSGIPVKTNE